MILDDLIKKSKTEILVTVLAVSLIGVAFFFGGRISVMSIPNDLAVKNNKEKSIKAYYDATRKFKVMLEGQIYESASYTTTNNNLNYITFEQTYEK